MFVWAGGMQGSSELPVCRPKAFVKLIPMYGPCVYISYVIHDNGGYQAGHSLNAAVGQTFLYMFCGRLNLFCPALVAVYLACLAALAAELLTFRRP